MRTARAGAVLLAALATVAVAAPVLAPHDPDERTGAPFARPSVEHPLGTNDIGQDLLSELIHGARVSLVVGLLAALAATLLGALVGVGAGYARGRMDAAAMRLVDVVLALPVLPLTIVIGVFAGPGLGTQLVVISAVLWAPVARELRAQVLSLRERDHIQALVAMGAPAWYVMTRHLAPAVAPLAVPQFILATKTAIVLEASLAFLGLGDVTTKSWGTMLSVAYSRSAFLTDAWLWWVVPPGLAIALTVLAFALLGYGLDERARPVLRDRGSARRRRSRAGAARAGAGMTDGQCNGAAVPLRIEGLRIGYHRQAAAAVHGADLHVASGEVVALVGESGSGKSSIAGAVAGLLPPAGEVLAGRILLCGEDVTGASPRRWRALRGARIGFVPQEAMSALNPVHTIEAQLVEAIRAHPPTGPKGGRPGRAEARRRAAELLELVGLDPARARDYPHQLSGGMRQRAVIAIAVANRPAVLVADEPTSGLDVLMQTAILDLLDGLRRRLGIGLLVISHDLPAVRRIADRVAVMRAGHLLEVGPTESLLAAPAHAYTRLLVGALDRRVTGRPPVPDPPPPLLRVERLDVTFGRGAGAVRAVRAVSLEVAPGEIVGLVGGSGAGKSTLARVVAGLVPADRGRILLDGVDLARVGRRAARRHRRGAHLVFQDPYSALPPTTTVGAAVAEPMAITGSSRAARRERVTGALRAVHLDPDRFAGRYPHQLSGGERQRVAIARALVAEPALIVADEPTGMLDATLRAGIVDLLEELRARRGIAVLHITHDLGLARSSCDRVVVMCRGSVVETGPTATVLAAPAHAYTAALVDAAGLREVVPGPAPDAMHV